MGDNEEPCEVVVADLINAATDLKVDNLVSPTNDNSGILIALRCNLLHGIYYKQLQIFFPSSIVKS